MATTSTSARSAGTEDPPRVDPSRIPFRLRIGVTGHRRLDGIEELEGRIKEALELIRKAVSKSTPTTVLFEAVSPLGEGADQLVARAVLEDERATLDVPLPMEPKTYLEDFKTDKGRREFWRLLGLSSAHGVVSRKEDRDDAYEDVGHYVVSTSDVLIALWDGLAGRGRGGTKEIRDWANRRGTPIVVISASPPFEFIQIRLRGLTDRMRETDRYNHSRVDIYPEAVKAFEQDWDGVGREFRLDSRGLRPLIRWIGPHFVRADLLAKRYRHLFSGIGGALFLLASGAVVTIGAQIAFDLKAWLAWVEAGLMLLALILWNSLRMWVRDPRVAYRFLAERFRSMLMLAAAGVNPSSSLGERREARAGDEWLAKAMREVWRTMPLERPQQPVEALTKLLKTRWVDTQVAYYAERARWHHRRHGRTNASLYFLFTATLIAAVLHALGRPEGHHWEEWLRFLAIALPALATAVGGIAAMRQDLRNSHRFRTMVDRLRPIGEDLGKLGRTPAPDSEEAIKEVQTLAIRADREMLVETGDWIDVMRFHQVELPV